MKTFRVYSEGYSYNFVINWLIQLQTHTVTLTNQIKSNKYIKLTCQSEEESEKLQQTQLYFYPRS